MQTLKHVAFALVPLATIWLLVELGLWAAGVEPTLRRGDPYVGFAGEVPLFVDEIEDGVRFRRTATNKLAFFNDQRFVAEKRNETRRVFCLGGSTTYGHPYFDSTSFCGWLRVTLPVAAPGFDWQVVNAGGISYASYRVAALMQQLVAEAPDYFIVYTGHNEFLEERTYGALRDRPAWIRSTELVLSRSRLYAGVDRVVSGLRGLSRGRRPSVGQGALPPEVEAQLESSTGLDAYRRDDALRRLIIERFGQNLDRMVETARGVDARVAFVVPADNLSDCSPFKSEPDAGLARADRADLEADLARGERAWVGGDALAARDAFAAASARSPRHAHARYGLARALRALGEGEAARVEFVRARDEDVCPLRALSPIVEAVRAASRRHDVPAVDLPALLRAEAGDPNVAAGEQWFLDHVHPTIEGHRLLGRALLAVMHDAEWLDVDPSERSAALDEAEQAHLAGMDPLDHGRALKNLAKTLSWAGKTEDAARAARRALEVLGDDAECDFVLAELATLRGETDRAIEYLERATRLDPTWAKAHNNLGVERMRIGRLEAALLAYDEALRHDPDHVAARFNRANALRRLGRLAEAAEAFVSVVERAADDGDAWFNLARTYEEMGLRGEALGAMRRVVELDPGDREAAQIVAELEAGSGGRS
ncbi:MAG: tetratricopeptide repeat protein [Myxococcota bacterium]